MKLNELHVRHATTGAPRHGHAIAGGGVGIGGVDIGLARATCRQHGMRCADGDHMIVFNVENIGTPAALASFVTAQAELGPGNQINADVFFQHRDIAVMAHFFSERVLHGGAGSVSGVNNATMAMAALAGQMKPEFGLVAGEGNALLDQPAHRCVAVFDNIARGGFVAQSGPGHQRIVNVGLDRVGGIQHRRDAALCPGRVGVLQLAFCDQCHLVGGGEVQRQRLAGQAAAENQDVKLVLGCMRHQLNIACGTY